jgi:hypothetical protein
MTKHYKNEQLMRFLVILGAILGLVWIISGFLSLAGEGFVPVVIPDLMPLERIFTLIIGLVVVVITLLVGMKPHEPLPFHWLVLIILCILLAIFGAGLYAVILVLIAAIIGIIEEL